MSKNFIQAALFSAVLIALPMAGAPITFDYTGTLNSQSVMATVTANFSVDSLTITVDGLKSNPTEVIQGLSAIDFSVTGGLTGTLTSVSGTLITIASNSTFSSTAGTPDWIQPVASDFYTTALGNSGPDHLVLGAPDSNNLYSNANGSIRGNGPHNPFVNQSITLVYAINGALGSSSFETFTLYFGTGPTMVSVTPLLPPNEIVVPEPGTYALIGMSLVGLQVWRRKRK